MKTFAEELEASLVRTILELAEDFSLKSKNNWENRVRSSPNSFSSSRRTAKDGNNPGGAPTTKTFKRSKELHKSMSATPDYSVVRKPKNHRDK